MKPLHIALALTLLSGCQDTSTALTGDDLATLLSEDQIFSASGLRFDGTLSIRADGTARIVIPGLGEDEGNWSIDDALICAQWNTALQGKQTCARIRLHEDGTYSVHRPSTGINLGTLTPRS